MNTCEIIVKLKINNSSDIYVSLYILTKISGYTNRLYPRLVRIVYDKSYRVHRP